MPHGGAEDNKSQWLRQMTMGTVRGHCFARLCSLRYFGFGITKFCCAELDKMAAKQSPPGQHKAKMQLIVCISQPKAYLLAIFPFRTSKISYICDFWI
jgi:hypothetical protein